MEKRFNALENAEINVKKGKRCYFCGDRDLFLPPDSLSISKDA